MRSRYHLPPRFHMLGIEQDVKALEQSAGRRNVPLSQQLLLVRLQVDFRSFLAEAQHVGRVSKSDRTKGNLEAVDYPGKESGIGDLRIWMVRMDAEYTVLGMARGSVDEIFEAGAPERGKILDRLRESFGPVDVIFDGFMRK